MLPLVSQLAGRKWTRLSDKPDADTFSYLSDIMSFSSANRKKNSTGCLSSLFGNLRKNRTADQQNVVPERLPAYEECIASKVSDIADPLALKTKRPFLYS